MRNMNINVRPKPAVYRRLPRPRQGLNTLARVSQQLKLPPEPLVELAAIKAFGLAVGRLMTEAVRKTIDHVAAEARNAAVLTLKAAQDERERDRPATDAIVFA